MDFTEAPELVQDSIIESIEEKLGVEFDWDNDYHMELAQEAMADNLFF